MAGFWCNKASEQRSAVSADFNHALMRGVMQTELVRIKALIITALVLLGVVWTVDLIDPEGLEHIWRGRFRPIYLSVILAPFILFDLWLHANILRHLRSPRLLPAT